MPPGTSAPVELSAEQRDVVEAIISDLKAGKPTRTLGGYAGTGKTTVIKHLAARYPRAGIVAPTGRAASVLRRKGVDAHTIHSTIYLPVCECARAGLTECVNQKAGRKCRIVTFRRRPFLGHTLLICDEASMVRRDVYHDLMGYGVPTIFVGDHGQLPPVTDKNETPFNLMDAPDYRLETIHRHGGEIPRFAQHLREGCPAYQFRPRDGSVMIADRDEPLERLPVMKADRIICATNRVRVGINNYYRRVIGRGDRVEPGDTVICLKNDDRGIYNGTLATVLSVDGNRFDIASEEGTFEGVPFIPEQFGAVKRPGMVLGERRLPFDYGYASTCHKAQGGEWPYVLVIEEYLGDRLWPHARWAYTAASRAQQRLVWRASTRIFEPSYDHDAEIGGAP
jgi:exodeoxyribonuclease-5